MSESWFLNLLREDYIPAICKSTYPFARLCTSFNHFILRLKYCRSELIGFNHGLDISITR